MAGLDANNIYEESILLYTITNLYLVVEFCSYVITFQFTNVLMNIIEITAI